MSDGAPSAFPRGPRQTRRQHLALATSAIAWGLFEVRGAGAQTIVVTGRRNAGEAPTTPRLSVVAVDAYPPRLDLNLDESYVVGDTVELQAAASPAFSSPMIDLVIPLDGSAAGTIASALNAIKPPQRTVFRARGVRGAARSAWSDPVEHGDTAGPVILSPATSTYPERSPFAHRLRADKPVRWTILPSVDASLVELADGDVVRLADNAVPDFARRQSYRLVVKATDFAGNAATQALLIRIGDIEDNVPSRWAMRPRSPYVVVADAAGLALMGKDENVGAACRVRANNARTGKRYFEVRIDAKDSDRNYVGLCSSLAEIAGGYDAVGLAAREGTSLCADGQVFHDGRAELRPALAFGAGDVVMVAFDSAARLVWFGRNGRWEGRPAAGTGGLALGQMPDVYAFAAVCAALGQRNGMTANFGASRFVHPAPQGFKAYV